MASDGRSDYQTPHLSLPTEEHGTIYKLRLSMKRRLSPQGVETPSPEGAGELRCLLRRLVEIDSESRQLLLKVFSLLEKDEKLEKYFTKRIEGPKVSKMWQLVEQVLACQEEGHIDLDELMKGDGSCSSDYNSTEKSIEESNEVDEEMRLERFRVRTIGTGSTNITRGGNENSKA